MIFLTKLQLLKEKIANLLINNTLDVNDKTNYLKIEPFTKKVDYNLSNFTFLDSLKEPIIKKNYEPYLAFFKRLVYVRSDVPPPNPNPEGINVWNKRVSWPSLQYGIAYKLNEIDQKSGSRKGDQLNADLDFLYAILEKKNLILNKIMYVTNQIFISLFKHYKLYLNSANINEMQVELINNKNYDVNNFLFYLKKLWK